MSAACSCDVVFSNTGAPGCVPLFTVVRRPIFVPLEANDGTLNKIAKTDTLDATFFNGKVNNADPSKRWYPIPALKNVTVPKADNITESFDDGTSAFIRDGVRSFTGLLVNSTVGYAGILKNNRCSTFGVYLVDINGNVMGYSNNDPDNLYPIPVDSSTWAPFFDFASDTTTPKTNVNFSFSPDLDDSYLQIITANNITGINLLNLDGLLDITATYSAITTTGFTVTLKTKFGDYFNPIQDEGLVLADFALFNITDSASVTITSVTENPSNKGQYVFVIPAQTSADVLRLTPTKAGRDYTKVVAATITIP